MDIDKISKLTVSLSKTIEDNHKLALPILSAKLNKLAKSYPNDQTILAISNIVDKLSDKQFFITRAELKKLYNTLHSRNTKFAEFFADELGKIDNVPASPTLYKRDSSSNNELNISKFGDAVLASALESVFDKTIPLKNYSKDAATKAIKSVTSILDSWNLKAAHIDVANGNEKFLVVRAEYHTPKGSTSFYIPVEVNNNDISEPYIFMGNTGPKTLNYTNIKEYLTQFAGDKLKIKADEILDVLVSVASSNRRISDAEIALIKLNANKKSSLGEFGNQIIGQRLEEKPVPDIKTDRSEESFCFEKKFNSPFGIASITFGQDKVKLGSDLVSRHLKSFGYDNHRITVNSSDSNTIFYGVSLDYGRVAFTVPVKVTSNKVFEPTVLLCEGSISPFSSKTINKLYMENITDSRVAATASAQYGLKPSELIDNIRNAVKNNNFACAEDSLNVLRNYGDEKAYAIGFKIYSSALAGNIPSGPEESGCSHTVKSPNNQVPVCVHTGLPINKVYQDKYGNCRPLYRKGMDESYEGAYFMNHKIFG
jgi:hypothetical protein